MDQVYIGERALRQHKSMEANWLIWLQVILAGMMMGNICWHSSKLGKDIRNKKRDQRKLQEDLFQLPHPHFQELVWRSSITPIDQLLCQAGHFLMSCDKTQWNKNQYRGNKLLIAVWDFYLRAGRGWKDWSYERGEAVAFQLSDFYEVDWSAATAGQDGLSSMLTIFERRFLCFGLCLSQVRLPQAFWFSLQSDSAGRGFWVFHKMRFLAAFSLLLVCGMFVKTTMTKQNAQMQQLLLCKSQIVVLPKIYPD